MNASFAHNSSLNEFSLNFEHTSLDMTRRCTQLCMCVSSVPHIQTSIYHVCVCVCESMWVCVCVCFLLVVKLFIIIFVVFPKSNYTNRSAHLHTYKRMHSRTHTLTNAHTYHWQIQLNSNVWLGSWQFGKGCVLVASIYYFLVPVSLYTRTLQYPIYHLCWHIRMKCSEKVQWSQSEM